MTDYAELHCHTNFSFLEGASHPEDLAVRAAELGLSAMAVVDHNGLYGAPRFSRALAEAGLAAIIGAEVEVVWPKDTGPQETQSVGAGLKPAQGVHPDPGYASTRAGLKPAPTRGVSLPASPTARVHPRVRPYSALAPHLTLLVEDAVGYANLCRLLSRGQLAGKKGEPRISLDDLAANSAGLVCLSGCRRGPLASALLRGERVGALERGRTLAMIFGPGRFWVEAQNHRLPEDRRLLAELAALAERLRVGLVATNTVLYARPSDRPLQDVLTCIKHRTTLERAGPLLRPNAELRLKSAAEMAELFQRYPQAVANTPRVAERCAFRLENIGYRFPSFPVPAGETPFSYLYGLCQQGARERYGPMRPEVSRQLAHELELIQKLGLAEYFLIVWDIMRFAKGRGILAQGRGSAANSVVAYVLGVTNVDPITLDLLFERFLSEERPEAPDIDIDFANKDREQVIQYVYERYGRDHAGMVCEVITYRPRSAIRDVGKALGLSLEQVDRLAKAVDHSSLDDLAKELGLAEGGTNLARETAEREQRLRDDGPVKRRRVRPDGSPVLAADRPTLLDLVRAIQHFPRHLGIHVGGMIVTKEPLEEVVPLERATMAERTVVQWDKDDVEAMGLVKIDLLGLGMLSLLQDALALIAQHHGIKVDLAKLGYDDPAVYDMLCRADAVGLFQVESRAQMNTLPRLKPRTFYDLVIEISLIRPGPIQGGSVHPYLRRRAGLEPVSYPHPKLEPVLAKTLGVPLFQEQGMRLAVAAAGFSPGKADQLRRAMGHKRSRERMAELYDDLVQGMAANGIPPEVGDRVWKQLSAFADYGFPESHAASFALLVYASAWIKLYYPSEFYCAILNNQPMGFYPPAVLVGDARRHGVTVLPVDVNRSRAKCTIEAVGEDDGTSQSVGAGFKPSVPATHRRQVSRHHAVILSVAKDQVEQDTADPADPSEMTARSYGDGTASPKLAENDLILRCAQNDNSVRHANPTGALRLGFSYVKGLGDAACERLEAEAERVVSGLGGDGGFATQGGFETRPYGSLRDFCARTRLDRRSVERLVAVGAFDSLGRPRRELLWELPAILDELRAGELPGLAVEPGAAPPLIPLTDLEAADLDYRLLGLSPDRHAMEFYRPTLAAQGVRTADELPDLPTGRVVRVAGLVICRQAPPTAGGHVFLTLEDETGLANVIVRPRVYQAQRAAIRSQPALVVEGPLQNQDGAISVMARRCTPLSREHLAGTVRSRDFH